ncbi:uncharacterized protein HMPREF1541_03933 [Cyphellophora europaea CBS 101466]|uniref:Uncharacterized protein n=1 Tax=Cyphellophora europaea (strain CBS 101466) TaxID=1220924 RepID=W2S218_CYPE1|nr:uncharacterized protein HMPREF1541_03933 [Cyphellophora europaea CBS 101466]ETN41994.1 hypothetical protein HMPREF1541_03933 [Cyphellophora europaea CBS 101466]
MLPRPPRAAKTASSTTKNASRASTASKPIPKRNKDALITPPAQPLPTPALGDSEINYSYAIARGEMGVLSFEPYKSLILPFWAFRTVPIAHSSATALSSIFTSYVERGDLVGADMTRKFIQMGMTRARRYANYRGGRKYDAESGEKKTKWEGGDDAQRAARTEKEEASELFKGHWRWCIEHEGYKELKERWQLQKKEWDRGHGIKGGKEQSTPTPKEEREVDDDVGAD